MSTPASPRRRHRVEAAYRDAGPVPQRHGAARDRRRMGRRPADARHAEPGDRHGAGAPSPASSAFRRRTCTIRSPFLGGGFGSKAILTGPQILAILAARDARPAGQAGAAAATRCTARSAIAAPTQQRLRLGTDGDGRLTALEHHARRRRPAASTTSSSPPLTPRTTSTPRPALATAHDGVRVDTGTPGPMRAPGEATGSAALEMRHRRGGRGLRPRSAGVPPAQLRRDRAGDAASRSPPRRCANATPQGAERFGWSGRPLAAAADARRGRPPRRLGHGHRALPCADVPGRGARGAARATAPGSIETSARATWARGPGRRWPRSPPTGSGSHDRPGRVPRRPLRPSRRRRRRRLGPYRDGGQRALTTPAATRSPGSPSSPPAHPRLAALRRRQCRRRGARRAPAPPRRRRAAARAMPTSSPAPASRRSRATARGARDPGQPQARAMFSHGAVFAEVEGRSRTRPDAGDAAGRRLRGGADHQPAPGAQPATTAA